MGKKRQFDEDIVLDQMANHFWKHGYSATKVDQLSEVTGLTKTSLYNAFGNKDALFLTSINFYVENSISKMMSYLNTEQKLSTSLEHLLSESFLMLNDNNLSLGCFLTNSIVELNANEFGLHAEVTSLFDKVREAKLNFFDYYVQKEMVSKDYSASELTDYYMTLLQGLRVQSRNDGAESKIQNPIKTFLKFIKSIEN